MFTKAGPKWNPDEPMSPPALVGSPENIRAEVEASFAGSESTDRSTSDALAAHRRDADRGVLAALLDLRDQGKVRAVGLSNHDVPLLEAAEALGHVDLLQPKFSAVYRDAAADVLPWCADHDTAAIVYSPMVSGLLTGSLSAGNVAMPPDDWRSHHPDFAEPAPRAIWHWPTDCVRWRTGTRFPVAAVAVAWTLAFRGSPVRSSARGARNRSTSGSPRAAWRSTTTTSTRSPGDQEDRGGSGPPPTVGRARDRASPRRRAVIPADRRRRPTGRDLAPVLPRERRVDPFTLPGAAHRRRLRSAVDLRT